MAVPVPEREGRSVPQPADALAPARSRRMAWALTVVALLLAAGGITLFVLYARGDGPVPAAFSFMSPKPPDVLAPSSAEETVLRTLRLAGFDRAVVGVSGGTVVVRVDVPLLAGPDDAERSWQTALTSGALAFPRAGTVVAQLFSGSTPLLEVSADADTVRDTAQRDDGAALRKAARFRYLGSSGGGQ
jgi:hypothetical protein